MLLVNVCVVTVAVHTCRALDYFSKSLKIAPLTWTTRATVYGNRAATLMMLERYLLHVFLTMIDVCLLLLSGNYVCHY